MSYKGTAKTVAAIGKELGVDYVFEGSVRREGERVRIVAQLIRASDQTHIWADRYERDLRSVLSLQSEVARQIAAQTRLSLSSAAAARLGRATTVHPDAYQAYLRGRFFLHQRTGEAIEKAREQFALAIAIEPSYAQAHAGLADAYELLASYGNSVPRETFQRGIDAAQRALELDPELAEPYASLGTIHKSYTWNWADAERAYRRAVELNPSSAEAHKGYGELLSFLGRHDDAIAHLTRAVELDPVSLLMHANLGVVYWRARRYDEAQRQMAETLDMDPNYMLGHLNVGLIHAARGAYDDAAAAFRRASSYSPRFGDPLGLLGHVYARAGKITEARAIGEELGRLSSGTYVSAYIRALYHLGFDERTLALSELERAYDERSWLVAMVKVDPLLDPLRSEPRFQALVQRLQFPD
jgi:tetratricopeptide (TPR) repeat protein